MSTHSYELNNQDYFFLWKLSFSYLYYILLVRYFNFITQSTNPHTNHLHSPTISINNFIIFDNMAEAVKVMLRCRPMNTKQKERGCKNIVEIDTKTRQVYLFKEDSKQQPKNFTFDYVFGADSPQNLIYEQSAFILVDNVLEGYNGTIFAYGQTGCGKTHTMMGGTENQQARGIIPRTFSQIMTVTKSDSSKTHLIRCSFMEIYNEQIHDLLGKDIKAKLQVKESPEKGIFVKDLNQIEVENIQKMEYFMEIGFKNRAVRATNMNNESSRSHSIFTIYIDSQEQDQKGNDKYKASKLNLVDLAGSERASKTGTTGDGLKQATKINLSLSALGNVISALVDGKTQHIPYRDSKLTRLLQDSLGGNTKTIMIAAVSPANYNYEETLSTLRYASRAKNIQNKPKINEDPKDALLREYMQEIKKLKLMLEGKMPMQMPVGEQFSSSSIQERIVYRQSDKQNTTMIEELRNKENMLKAEQQEKRKLAEKLQSLQGMLSKGEETQKDSKQLQRIKKLKEKLKMQKKKEEQYERQKAKRQSELLHIQKNYKSLNEQVDEMRERFQQIKKKYVSNLSQLRDIQVEHQEEKEGLLDTIRYQEKQIKKFTAILNILMNQDQLDLIINNSQWSQERRQWTVPSFTYKERSVVLPKIGREIDNDKNKEIVFRDSKRDTQRKQDVFKMNQIVKNARESNEIGLMGANSGQGMRSNSVANRTQLTPLKNQSSDKLIMPMNMGIEERKRKTDKLDPIQYGRQVNDPRKYFQS